MFETFPQLTTERLELIEIKKIHLIDFFNLFRDERVARYYQIIPFKEVKDAQVYLDLFEFRLKRGTGIRWGMLDDRCGFAIKNWTIFLKPILI